jgi:acetyl esterase/lipase
MTKHGGLFLPAALICAIWPRAVASAQQQQPLPYPPVMADARAEVYKVVGDASLNAYIFNPPGHSAGDRRPAIVFFFGGGWRMGSPQQFEQQCRYLASRGMVAISADYRVASRHGAKIVDCVRDAKSAIRWVRLNAARLGIDPRRVAAGGASAGGHLAASCGVLNGFEEAGEDLSISSRPDALVLFNPAAALGQRPAGPAQGARGGNDGARSGAGNPAAMRERAGIEPREISPAHHIRQGAPPAIVFHGKADTTVPYAVAELFTKRMKEAGNRCELVGFEAKAHGFFNYRPSGNPIYYEVLKKTDEFLASLGYLEGKPTIR